jgi:hypothetical protein
LNGSKAWDSRGSIPAKWERKYVLNGLSMISDRREVGRKTVNNFGTVRFAAMSVFKFELERDIPRGRLFSCFEELKPITNQYMWVSKRDEIGFEADATSCW